MILDVDYTVCGVRFRYNEEKSLKNSLRKDRGFDHQKVANCLLSSLDSMDNPGYPGQVLEFTYIEGKMFTVATSDGSDYWGQYFGIYTYWQTEKLLERRILARGGF